MSSTRLWTKKICPPRFNSRSTAWRINSGSKRATRVSTARRSSGGVSRFEMSRSPSRPMCSVRGMGVAVIVSTSTICRSAFSRSFTSTPNRCSSSITTSPRLWKCTSGWASRCVPMTMSIEPSSRRRMISVCCRRVANRDRAAISKGNSAIRSVNVRRCCSHSSVVGTSTATW